jgi:PAS domain S-box-containing protein
LKTEILQKALNREKEARREAERILQNNSIELFNKINELALMKKELALQNKKKKKHADTLFIDNGELALQNEVKDERTDELANIKVELEQQIVCLDEAAILSEADANGNIIFVNDKFCEISGYKREELIGKNHRILKSNKQPEGLFIGMWAAISAGRVWKGKVMNKKKGGKDYYWVDTTIMPFKDLNGKIVKYVGIRFDITTQVEQNKELDKRANELILANKELAFQNKEKDKRSNELTLANKEKEEKSVELALANTALAFQNDLKQKRSDELAFAKDRAEESDRLKSAFLANMSHEIRTPMNGILGFVDLLKEPNLTGKEQQEYIGIIEKSGIRMLNIINDIISISKIESGLMKVNIQELNINKQIEFIHTFFKPEVEAKGMRFVIKNTLKTEEAFIKSDSEKIYGILTNLVKNSIKYSETGTIELGLTLKKRNETKELEFYIKDTGIGIPHDRKISIFERFIQADISDKRAYQGAGLGLSISKAYVEMLGGKIWVETEEKKGSKFTFTIPYLESNKKETNNNDNHFLRESISESEEFNLEEIQILLVEDDLMNQVLVKNRLAYWNCSIDIVSNGKLALKKVKEKRYDLILMDIQMPEMDGYETTKEIRKLKSLASKIPIIAMTAHATSEIEEKALNAGMNDYISKPFNPKKLYCKITNTIKNNLVDLEKKMLLKKTKSNELIDITYLKEVCLGDQEMLLFLIQLYIDNLEAFLITSKKGINKEDFEIIYKAAHKIKPNVIIVGNKELQSKIDLIHDLSKEKKELSEISKLLTITEDLFYKVRNALQHKITTLKTKKE